HSCRDGRSPKRYREILLPHQHAECREPRIHLRDLGARALHDRLYGPCRLRVDQQSQSRARVLIYRQKHIRLPVFVQRVVPSVLRDADNLHKRRALLETKAFTQRVSGAAVKSARKLLIHYDDRWRPSIVVAGKIAAHHQRHAQSLEVILRHITALQADALIRSWLGLAFLHDKSTREMALPKPQLRPQP